MSKAACACIASLALGAGIGWTLGAKDVNGDVNGKGRSAPGAPITAATTHLQVAPAASGIDVALLRSVMREEISAAMANERTGGQAAVNAVKQTPAPPELVAQRQVAVEEIESMINGARWGNDQRIAFQQRIAMLDPEAAERALRRVTIALNEGTMQVTTDGPPL